MPIPCQASFFIDTSNLQSARDIEDNVDSTQRDPARKLYYSRLFFFFLFFLSLLPCSRTTYTCLPISPFRSDHLSPFAYPFLDPTSRFFAPFFTPPFLSSFTTREQSRRTIVERRVPEEIPFSSSFLSVAVPCFFPTFSPFSSFPPRDLSSLFHLPFNRRPPAPSERLFRCWRVRVTIQVSSLADAKEERIRRMWILSVGRRVSVETVRGAPISSRGLGRAAEWTVKNEIKRVELFLKRSNAYIRRVGTPHASARLIVFFFSA